MKTSSKKKHSLDAYKSGKHLSHHQPYDVSYKVLIVGDSGVGKTALIKALMGKPFTAHYMPTIGVDFVRKIFEIDGAKIQLEIWDTAGQERFRSITRFQYRGAKGLLLIYDVTSKSTYSTTDYWIQSIDKEVDQHDKEPVPVVIVGNKCDLTNLRAVSPSQGKKMAEQFFVHAYEETSARNGQNVYQTFYKLAEALAEIYNPKLLNSYLSPLERKEKSPILPSLEKSPSTVHLEEEKKKFNITQCCSSL